MDTLKYVSFAIALCLAPLGLAQEYHLNPELVSGPQACAECHEKTTEIWKKTHHAKTFKELPRREKSSEISGNLGVKRIKTAPECSGCHFTAEIKGKNPRAIAGISCESCHSAGRDWIDVHSDFGGKDIDAENETASHRIQRYQLSEAAGMIRPANIEGLIRNCYSCHMISDERLVNVGGHSSSSNFEIVRWSQGEVRHNVWYSDNNQESSIERRRVMFMLGQVLNYEYAIRALAMATENGDFAQAVARQAKLSQRRLTRLNQMQSVDEIAAVLDIANATKLVLNKSGQLTKAADQVATLASRMAKKYDGKDWNGIDAVLPKPEQYKGSVSE
ncbi:MAG: multiheme c-type cytochrome [Pseudomonadota bacterium]